MQSPLDWQQVAGKSAEGASNDTTRRRGTQRRSEIAREAVDETKRFAACRTKGKSAVVASVAFNRRARIHLVVVDRCQGAAGSWKPPSAQGKAEGAGQPRKDGRLL